MLQEIKKAAMCNAHLMQTRLQHESDTTCTKTSG